MTTLDSKSNSYQAMKCCLAKLSEEFPQAFIHGKDKKPLILGVHKLVLAHFQEHDITKFSNKLIRNSISFYTSRPSYLTQCRCGAPRINLDGSDSTQKVTAEQASYAKQKFHQVRQAQKQKKAKPASTARLSRLS